MCNHVQQGYFVETNAIRVRYSVETSRSERKCVRVLHEILDIRLDYHSQYYPSGHEDLLKRKIISLTYAIGLLIEQGFVKMNKSYSLKLAKTEILLNGVDKGLK